MRKITLAVLTILAITIGTGRAQVNGVVTETLTPINQCYHGTHNPDPCDTNSYAIAIKIVIGQWNNVDKPWSIKFTPKGVFDVRSGTIVMSTIGPPKSGKYRIEHRDNEHYPAITVIMDDGERFKASIAMYGNELLLMSDGKTSTFHRS